MWLILIPLNSYMVHVLSVFLLFLLFFLLKIDVFLTQCIFIMFSPPCTSLAPLDLPCNPDPLPFFLSLGNKGAFVKYKIR